MLDALLQKFDNARLTLLDEVAALDPAVISKRPSPNAWSVLEIVEHLMRAERWVFHDLAPFEQIPVRVPRFKQRLRRPLVMFVLGSRIKVSVPVPVMHPTAIVPLATVRAQWDENQAWLRALVRYLGPQGLDRAVLRHPVAGPLTVEQGVLMGQLHLDRHVRQLHGVGRALRASPTRPA
jgi:hypothetical protein